jgi:RNA polymerase sigma-70 factor, ECF subfamily
MIFVTWNHHLQRPMSILPVARTPNDVSERVAQIFARDSRRVFASLVRQLGDFDRAEEALQEAFRAALEQWQTQGLPSNPIAWLISAGRFKAIDQLRRSRRQVPLDHMVELVNALPDESAEQREQNAIEDDRLRLIFTCCHPALAENVQVALTLREVCGLATEEIARAFLIPPPTLAQRIVRAKAKIRDAAIPYQIPDVSELPARLPSVLRVVYLVFNEGYLAATDSRALRADLSGEAIRLGRLLFALLPDPEVMGLLALMLLHESRRSARTNAMGELIPLEEQDRNLWRPELISEGATLVQRALSAHPARATGPYTLQAAIAALHAQAANFAATDWSQIAGLYQVLLHIQASPVVALNHAVAVAMRDGPQVGLALIDSLLKREDLTNYHLAHAAKADLHRRLGQFAQAHTAYERALALAQQEAERMFLRRRLAELA